VLKSRRDCCAPKGVSGKFRRILRRGLEPCAAEPAQHRHMAPEYGRNLCASFPIDGEDLRYLQNHRPRRGRASRLVEAYARKRLSGAARLRADLTTPTRCHLDNGRNWCPRSPARNGRRTTCPDRAKDAFHWEMAEDLQAPPWAEQVRLLAKTYTNGIGKYGDRLDHVCYPTLNPYVMIGAGLVARKAAALA